MPRSNPKNTVTPNAFVASAAKSNVGVGKSWSKIARTASDGWQREAWMFYRTIGEFRYACDWVGSMLSKAVLYATVEKDGRKEHITEGAPFDFIQDLFGDADGKAEMLRLIGIHFSVAGECFVLGYRHVEHNKDGRTIVDEERWQVVSSIQLRNSGTDERPMWTINGRVLETPSHADVLVVRLWRPDPDDTTLAISPARAILSTLGELAGLTEHIAAQIDSRLAGAGLLLMPTEMNFPAAPDAEGEPGRTANNAQDLMAIIHEAMATSLEDRGDASAQVPIVVTAPAEAIAAVKHITFWSDLDEKVIEMRNEAIRRLGLGMDMPPEVLQGVGEANHWNAWQADESSIKAHTEPLLKIVTTLLAREYLRPLLATEASMDGAYLPHYSIGADTSEMRLRPNRSKEALELHDRGLLSDEALLRETGFDPVDDGMDDEQRKTWLLRKIASGSSTPEQVEAALKVLYKVDLGTSSGRPAVEGNESRPDPSLKDHPTRDIPDQERSVRRKEARERGDVPSAV